MKPFSFIMKAENQICIQIEVSFEIAFKRPKIEITDELTWAAWKMNDTFLGKERISGET